MAGKMTTCKHCGAEIAASAKVCPQCGGKNPKPIYKRPWFIVLIVLVVLIAASTAAGGGSPSNGDSSNGGSVSSKETSTPQEITYTAYDVSELMADLDSNALKASDKYKGQYVELTGKLDAIDSDGSYISITPTDDIFSLIGVQCYIKSDEQKNVIMDVEM